MVCIWRTVEVELWGTNLDLFQISLWIHYKSLQICPLFPYLQMKNNFYPERDDVNQTKAY